MICETALSNPEDLGEFTGRCWATATATITLGCVHEHFSEGSVCEVHATHPDNACGTCWRAGHLCPVQVVRTVPL